MLVASASPLKGDDDDDDQIVYIAFSVHFLGYNIHHY